MHVLQVGVAAVWVSGNEGKKGERGIGDVWQGLVGRLPCELGVRCCDAAMPLQQVR